MRLLWNAERMGFLTSGGVQVHRDGSIVRHLCPALYVFRLYGLRIGRHYFGFVTRDTGDHTNRHEPLSEEFCP